MTAQSKCSNRAVEAFKKSQIFCNVDLEILGDQGDQGINKLHKNSKIPFKKPPKKDLDKEQIKFNKTLGKERIIIEHINRKLKIFKILSSRYRNRHKRFGLRLNLIAGIYNFEQKYNVLLLEKN